MNAHEASRYAAACNDMWVRSVQWRTSPEHIDKEAKIQFNFPPYVAVIAPISEAIKHGLVTGNAEGLDLIKFLCAEHWEKSTEPTVLMIRAVLEFEAKECP